MRMRGGGLALVAVALAAGFGWQQEASAQEVRDDIDIVCPCRIESRGNTASITAGVRNFGARASGKLALYVIPFNPDTLGRYKPIAKIPLENTVAGGAILAPARHIFEWERRARRGGDKRLLGIALAKDTETRDADGASPNLDLDIVLDMVLTDTPVDLARPFDIASLDLLTDTDGDGVSDYNEVLEGTDPGNPASTPGPSIIDVLALYNQGFASLYGGDPATRIQHVMAVADGIYRDSDTGVRLRLVGVVEAPVDPQARDSGVLLDEISKAQAVHRQRDEYGADLVMMFSRKLPDDRYCGRAYNGGHLGPLRLRGHMRKNGGYAYSVVSGNCSGSTAAHEIGHNLGLNHSFAQDDHGTYRWARGHGVNRSFVTVMAYSSAYGNARSIDVFSDPDRYCGRLPCGKHRNTFDGADAVAAIQAVRFQAARFREQRLDADGDGLVDSADPDDDNDGVADGDDAFPFDPTETTDTDSDGVGDNADTDDDNDGVADNADAFPLDPTETADSDGDGTGDNADAFPLDPAETVDTDGDGTGNNADTDDDNDGVPDEDDAFPLDPAETADSDKDGTGDKADAFPLDPNETTDTDGDGVGDNWDLLPRNPSRSDLTASYKFVGESVDDQVSVVATGDFDGDGRSDIAVGAPEHDSSGAVLLINAADLRTIDAADGSADQIIRLHHVASAPNSWKLLGEYSGDGAGISLATADLTADGRADIIVGARLDLPRWRHDGAVYLVASASLAAADASDGRADGVVDLGRTARFPGSWKLVGGRYEKAGASVASVPDLDGDERPEVAIGAPGYDRSKGGATLRYAGAVRVVASGDLAQADAADGRADGVVDLTDTAALPNSWKLLGEAEGDQAGFSLAATGDLDGDGLAELLASAPYHDSNRKNSGAVYLLSGGKLAAADAVDGAADGVIALERASALSGNWKFVGAQENDQLGRRRWSEGISSAIDLNVDKSNELIVGGSRGAWIVSGADLGLADSADGAADGVIDLLPAAPPSLLRKMDWLGVASAGDTDGDGKEDFLFGNSWYGTNYLVYGADFRILPDPRERLRNYDLGTLPRVWQFRGIKSDMFSAAGDIDGDGLGDLLLGSGNDAEPGELHVVLAADLAVLDQADGIADRIIAMHNIAGDADGDGVRNIADPDDDNDGAPDENDAFPLDPAEWADSDGDGTGDNADAFPLDPKETVDTDGDGTGNNADLDDDNDGIPDSDDPFPLDPSR